MRFRALALTLVTAATVRAQQPARIELRSPVILPEEFTSIGMIRELADGRVLVADNSSADGRLVVADFTRGTVEGISRVGNGPREYVKSPRRLFPLPNDSTLMLSGSQPPRWSILAGAQIVATVPPDSRVFLQAYEILGADDRGSVLGRRTLGGKQKGPSRTDYVYGGILGNRASDRVDTIFTLAGESYHIGVGEVNNRPFYALNPYYFSAPEAAMMFPDGWIVVVRVEPYHVEWRTPTGSVIKGPPLPWTTLKVDARERAAYAERLAAQNNRPFNAGSTPFNETVVPIRGGLLLAAPNGLVVIPRQQWSGAPNNAYDFVDRKGALAATMTLPTNQRLIGFGPTSVYISVTDDDGIQRLRRHPWP